jgi:proline dehydrogenase
MSLLRSTLIALSKNQHLRRICERSRAGRRLSSRFVAGLEIEDALRAAEFINSQGMTATLDSLGESVTSEAEARQAAEVYHQLLEAIATRQLSANISVKLTQMGLERSPELAWELVESLVAHAHTTGSFVCIDMEGSQWTQVTLDIVRRLHARPDLRGSVGAVIQACLYRSQADIAQLLADGIRIRLCKGAYKEPAEIAFPHKADVDANYLRLSSLLLDSPLYHGLATHDEAMIAAAKVFVRRQGIDSSRFEFQMLFGVRRGLQRTLVGEGYNVRIYIPFGRAWYPYFMRRLAERPANLLFLIRNLLRS